MPRPCRRTSLFLLLLLLSSIVAAAQTRPQQRRPGAPITSPRPAASPRPSAAEPTYTGVWEPVNYPDDVILKDVFFANSRAGWIAGHSKGGFILHTSDGGEHWEVQAGDPQSPEEAIDHLRFIDAHNGWAIQHEKLLHTADGNNWVEAGALPKFMPFINYTFTSPRSGILLAGYYNNATIFRTDDGGKNWKPVFPCAARIQEKGLSKNVACYLHAVHFVSRSVGIAVGGGFNGGYNVVARTDDGGASWRLIFVTTEVEAGEDVFFTSENTGVMRTKDAKIYYTSDGGQTWTGLLGTARGPLRFADPEVGWSCWGRTCSFTFDGGQHWSSREFAFPGQVEAFSIPRRDRVFVVGDHGMIYRYRIVRSDQVAQNMIPAPTMPLYGGPVGTSLDKLRNDVGSLRRKLAAAGVQLPPPTSGAGAAATATAASAGGDTSAAPFSSAEAEAQAEVAVSPDAAASGTLVNSSASAGANAADANNTAGASPAGAGGAASANAAAAANAAATTEAAAPGTDAAAASSDAGGFAQDTTAPSAAIQGCCASDVQNLQSDFAQFTQAAPTFGSKFRNLNLLITGLNMAGDLLNKAKGIKDSFAAFKKAPSLQAAANLLQDLSTKIDSTRNSFINGFKDINAGGSAGGSFGSAAGAIGGAVGGAFSGTPLPADTTPAPAASSGTATPASKSDDSKAKPAQKKNDSLKNKLKGLGIPMPPR